MILPDIDKFYKDLGERIKTERMRRKINQEVLAIRLDLTRASITNLEKGRHRPSIYQLIQIANFLELDYNQLIPTSLEKQPSKRKLGDKDMKGAIIGEEVEKAGKAAALNFLTSIDKG